MACAAAVMLLVTGCGHDGAWPSESVSVSPGTSADQMVALWRLDGGFVPPGTRAIRSANLAVFADGRAIADANRVIRLSSTEMTELLTALTRDLADQPPTAIPRRGSPWVSDTPDVVLGVIKDSALKTVKVPVMDAIPSRSYDVKLVDARDRMGKIAERALSGGAIYTADRIRVVAEKVASDSSPVRPWPSGIPVPDFPSSGVGTEALSGDNARTAMRVLPRDTVHFTEPSGARVAVSWRYLLPDESS
jgi:hypothetical protein